MTLAVAPARPATHKQYVSARGIFLVVMPYLVSKRENEAEKIQTAKRGVWMA